MSNDAIAPAVQEATTKSASVDAEAGGPTGKTTPEPVKKTCSPGLTGWMRRNRGIGVRCLV